LRPGRAQCGQLGEAYSIKVTGARGEPITSSDQVTSALDAALGKKR